MKLYSLADKNGNPIGEDMATGQLVVLCEDEVTPNIQAIFSEEEKNAIVEKYPNLRFEEG